MHHVAAEFPLGRGAEVIFDVARALHVLGMGGVALELGEDLAVGLGHEGGEDVQPAAMRHAQRDLPDAQFGAPGHQGFQRRNERFRALEAETLGPGVLQVQKALETLALGEFAQDGAAFGRSEAHLVVTVLDHLLDPGLFLGALHVHVLDPNRAAIGASDDVEDLAQRRRFQAEGVVDEDRPIHGAVVEAIGLGIELGMLTDRCEAERVQVGLQMATHPVGTDHHQRADRIQCRLAGMLGRDGADRRRRLGGDGMDLGRILQQLIVATGLEPPRILGCPTGALELRLHVARLVAEFVEEIAPTRVQRARAGQIALIELLDEGAVGAIEEGRRLGRFGHTSPPARCSGAAYRLVSCPKPTITYPISLAKASTWSGRSRPGIRRSRCRRRALLPACRRPRPYRRR